MFRVSCRAVVPLTIAAMLFTLAACRSASMSPGGGGNNDGGGPTPPGPVATTGTISGTVTAAGVGVSGARVMLGLTAFATTASSGQYTLADVAAGTHTVTLVQPRLFTLAAGETSAKSTAVTAGQTTTVDWTLVQVPVGPVTVVYVVQLDPTAFRPRDVTIARGDSVLWVNAQPVFHTISPDDRNQPGAWRTENMPARTGASFSHVFDENGIFHYSCTVHIGMTGIVRVR